MDGAAAWVWRAQVGGFATSLAIPLTLLGLAACGVGGFLAWKSYNFV